MLRFCIVAFALLVFLGQQVSAEEKTVKILSIAVDLEEERTYRAELARSFETANPGVSIEFDYIANEAFKTKLPTLLQSEARPDIFFSWGGGVYTEQARAGLLQDISSVASQECLANHSAAGLGAFSRDGALNGLPMYAAEVGFWVNESLAAEAGVDLTELETWEGFLSAVQQIKAAGITPIVVGGKDKWPLHFYYSMLALRILGADGIDKASKGLDGGYASEGWIAVGTEFVRLAELEPFQPGYQSAGYEKAAALFGDGEGVFHLMGNWDYNTVQANAANGEGIGDANLRLIAFPVVEGGAGSATDTFGGINGWLVSRDASEVAVDFLCFMLNTENQKKAGELGFWIPVAKNSAEGISNPFFAQVSRNLAASSYHQLFLDQALGASVGGTINDVSADLAAGLISPQEGAELIEEARLFQ